MDPFSGRVALVTGGARGIGRALATALVEAGAEVALADLDAEAAAATASELGPRVRPYALDVRSPAGFDAVVDRVEREQGAVDALFNNAGIMVLGGFLATDPALDVRQVEINLMGVAHGMRAVLPRMLARRRGAIVNVASTAGKVGPPNAAMYAATKHAVVGLTEAVRYEHEGSGVSFHYVLPALVDTELIAGARRLRFPPVVAPKEVARAALDAVRRGRVDTYVPRFARLSALLPAVLPRAVYERVGRLLGVDRVFVDVDAAARSAYHARVAGGSPGQGPTVSGARGGRIGIGPSPSGGKT